MTRAAAWLARWFAAAPDAVVIAAAALAAVAATYPLLAGRSLVAPSNGGALMLYDRPPFTPGAYDFVIEDVRGTDTGSMMWGILPYARVQREALAAGEWPLWDRYSGLGRPLWGQGQSLFLDPIHLLSLALPQTAAGFDLQFLVARVVFAVGTGLAAFAATGSARAAATIGAAAPFIGYFTFRMNHPAAFSLTYVPWLLWSCFMLAKQPAARGIAAWSAAVAITTALQIVASTPKEGAIALMACQAIGWVTVLAGPGPWTPRLHRAAGLAVGGFGGLLLSAPHWLVFLDTLSRAWTAYDVPLARFAGGQNLVSLALGAALKGFPLPGGNAVIAAGVLLALAGIGPAARLPAVAASAVVSVAFLVVAVGGVPADWLVRLPLIGNLHQVDFSFVGATIVPMAIVAAGGFAVMTRALASRRGLMVLALVEAAAVAALVFIERGSGRLTGAPVFITIAAALALPWAMRAALGGLRTTVTMPAAIALLAVILAPSGLHLDTHVPALDSVLLQPRPRADVDAWSPAVRAVHALSPEPFRAVGIDMVLFPGTQTLYRIEGLIGADAIELPHLRELGSAAGMFRHPWGWITLVSAGDVQPLSPLLDLFGMRALLAAPEVALGVGRKVPLPEPDLVQVFERPTAWPRSFFADGVEHYDTPKAFLDRLARAGGPIAAVQSTDTQGVEMTSPFPRSSTRVVPAHSYVLTPNTTTFTVTSPTGGVAVLGEAFVARDFLVTLNGRRTPYFRVNHLFKGVIIPAAGEWRVTFEYRPALWGISWALAGAGALLLAALGAVARFPRKA